MSYMSLKNQKRILAALVICLIIAVLLFARLVYIQVIKSNHYRQMAYEQQTRERKVSAKRGTIYDATGTKVLAQSVSVSSIKAVPNSVENKEEVAKKLAEIINEYKDLYDFKAVVPVSVKQKKNLDEVINEIENNLKEGPAYYDINEYTNQSLRELVEEIVREKALKLLQDEVPHGIFVETTKMKTKKTKNNEKIFDIEATIFCLRESHKGIIIGKQGSMLKKIGSFSREDLEKMLDSKVNLKLWVKVKENWINEESFVNKFKTKE